MKQWFGALFVITAAFALHIPAQRKRPPQITPKKQVESQSAETTTNTAVVVDERLAVLRIEPSLYARPMQRMRRGRTLSISGSKEADGVTFYKVNIPPSNYGWIQADAVAGNFKRGDEERLAKLIQGSSGFDQIERAELFLQTFPSSTLRPPILLLLGDLLEELALKLSTEATKRLDKREMSASGAPLHSFYLNYAGLDRYRKIGINFVFNSATKSFHYDGAAWQEIISKSAKTPEAVEAKKRLDSLKEKMEAGAASGIKN
jgi:hypothetical protein